MYRKLTNTVWKWASALYLAGIVVFLLAPFVWTILTSLKPETEIVTKNMRILPVHWTLDNYKSLFGVLSFGKYFRNSIIVSLSTAMVSLILSNTAAYAISRFRFKGRRSVMLMLLTLNMFPVVLLLIPLFIIFRQLHLLDSYLSLIIAYSTYAIPFSVWMLTGYLNSIPQELEEAAMVDGCSRFRAYISVILPAARPGLIATFIYIFIYSWNEFLFALTFIQSADTRTLPVGIQTLIGQYTLSWGLLTAGGIFSSIPVIIMFSFIQKHMVKGLTAGAVKG
ncbi:carbohydrate ABC transporter permease [Marispirochaeta sp.]|uniref:carbohydrate ABC transporter permease n=1 Tax=Marispirochaeta sp. TaxID=2038653 RepID=UPI0029C693E4|nr:carbohydrate ABC transporter permease [Marispirochaeta sp.]